MFGELVSVLDASGIVEPERTGDLSPDQLVDMIGSTHQLESALKARELAAVAGLLKQRTNVEQENPERAYDVIDGYEQTCAEVSAVLNISPTAASYVVHYAEALADRLPRVAALPASGQTDWRTVQLIISRTDLVKDELIGELDERLAARLGKWKSWSRQRIINAIDAAVLAVDTDAAKERRKAFDEERFVSVDPLPCGMAQLYGHVSASDGATVDHTLSALAKGVCANDPRTMDQRRADALAALTQGKTLACQCGNPDCPARGEDAQPPRGAQVVVNVVASEDALAGDSDRPGYLEGYGVIDAEQLRELAAQADAQRIVQLEASAVEALRYQPSAALERAVRCRDLTCRFPGCSRPATHCDIDHTVPFSLRDPENGGWTVPSNLKCLCRKQTRLTTLLVVRTSA